MMTDATKDQMAAVMLQHGNDNQVQEALVYCGAPSPLTPPDLFECQVRAVLDDIAATLIEKNRKYGDSALNPKRVFSRASAVEQIKVRLDDKLSRLMNQQPDEDEDVELDLMGYLVLLRIAKMGTPKTKADGFPEGDYPTC